MIFTGKRKTRPYFIFGGKTWEIEEKYVKCDDGRILSTITFENIYPTGAIDPELGHYGEATSDEPYWTIIETVVIKNASLFADEEIAIYQRNAGKVVGEKRHGQIVTEIDILHLPLFVIKKLAHVANELDSIERRK